MEKLDGTINDYINKKIALGNSFGDIIDNIKNKINILHQKLIKEKITIEENISDNYMFKDEEFKRIDFTKSHIKDSLTRDDFKKYKFIYITNPMTRELQQINIF